MSLLAAAAVRRPARLVVAACALAGLLLAFSVTPAALAWVRGTGSGEAAVQTLSAMPAAGTPTVAVSGRQVTVTAAPARFPDEVAAAGYRVHRLPAGGNPSPPGGFDCAGDVGAGGLVRCEDPATPPGQWHLALAPVHGGWTGSPGPPSAAVTVAAPSLTAPASAPAGSRMTLSVAGFIAGHRVWVRLGEEGPILVNGGTVPAGGSFSTSVTVPTTAPPGDHTLVASATPSGETATAPLTVTAAPDVPPSTPTGLRAVAGDRRVALSWAVSSGPVTGYEVRQAASPSGPFTVVGTPTAAGFTARGLTNGRSYWFTVTAVGPGGSSAPTAAVSSTPVGPPTAPTSISAVPGDRQVALAWTPPADDGGRPLTGYQLRRMGGTTGETITLAATTTSHVAAGLTNGITYRFEVRAVNELGVSSTSALSDPVTPLSPPNVVRTEETVPAGGVVTVGHHDPAVTTSVTSSAGGLVEIEQTTGELEGWPDALGSYAPLPITVVVHGPPAPSPTDPNMLTVTFPDALLDGADPGEIVGLRDGRLVDEPCGEPGVAVPDPCLLTATSDGESVTVGFLTTEYSVWHVAVRTGGVFRWFGTDRAATAAAVSRATMSPDAPVVFVATQRDFPDALAGGPLAARHGAPILLVDRDGLPAATAAELTRLAPKRIVVLGGAAVVSEAVALALAAHAPLVERLAGADRFETAAAISASLFDPGVDAVYLATGGGFADALSGGAAAALDLGPVLLTDRDVLPEATRAELIRLRPREIVVLGGAHVVSDAVEAALVGHADRVVRAAGADRFATSAAVSARTFPAGAETVLIATGHAFPDALAGVPAAGLHGAPLLLVSGVGVPPPVAEELARLRPRRIVILGGPDAVPAAVADALGASVP